MSFIKLFNGTKPIIPVMVINNIEQAVPLANALIAGGIHCLEVTLRTAVGLDAIELISNECPGAIVGAGTVTSAKQMQLAKNAGAKFLVSPGISHELCQKAMSLDLPYAPGVMTPSDIIIGLEYGISLYKLFPADIAGGPSMIQALSGPFPDIQFCPTGGVLGSNAAEYLSLQNVAIIGGSWVCPSSLIEAKNWKEVERLANSALT